MKFSVHTLSLVTCVALLLVAAGTAHASSVTGQVYCGIEGPDTTSAHNPQGAAGSYALVGVDTNTLANAESTSTGGNCASFTTNVIDFSAPGASDTLLSFLTQPGDGTSFSRTPTNQLATGNLIVLTGSTYLSANELVTLSHDDGVNLYISGNGLNNFLLLGSGGETVSGEAPFSTGNITPGTYSFELLYVSNYESPSVLDTDINTLPTPTPEPSSIALLGTGLLAAAGAIRRRLAA